MLIFLAVGGFGLGCYFSDWFRVEGIFCEASGEKCEEMIWLQVSKAVIGKPIWLINRQMVADDVLTEFSWVASTEVKKYWPHSLEIKLRYHQPAVEICLAETPTEIEDQFVPPKSAECGLRSREAIELPRKKDLGLPKIYLTKPDQGLVIVLCRLVTDLQKESLVIQEGWVLGGQKIAVIVIGGRRIIFSLEKESAGQVDSLQAILTRAKINDRPVSQVDFRFDKPVVRFVKN